MLRQEILKVKQYLLCYMFIIANFNKDMRVMRNLLLVILLSLSLTEVLSAPMDQLVQIDQIPYRNHPWYSGYLNIPNSRIHYVYFDSQRDPDNDPLVLWLNGGPGCSSLIGMVNENGPFVFVTNSTEWKLNENSWNLRANVLYIQSPGGVGFSTSTKKVHNDTSVADDNLKALLVFFTKFPNLKKNDFYITGESYAGIYVPTLALNILNYNKLPSSKETRINIKGIMVGNACTDPRECYQPLDGMSLFQYKFLFNHGFYTQNDYDLITAICTLGYRSKECKQIMGQMDKNFAKTKTSILNIYAPCYSSTMEKRRKGSGRFKKSVGDDTLNCDDTIGIMTFFNIPGMWQKLHVEAIHYQMCSDSVGDNYQQLPEASYWIYPLLIQANLRVWVYSGDVDADVPITGTITWIQRLREEFGLPVVQPWRQWWVPGLHKHQDQVGGMTWALRGLTFASVKGAGHMVPQDKRKEASVLFNSFLSGTPLPFKSE